MRRTLKLVVELETKLFLLIIKRNAYETNFDDVIGDVNNECQCTMESWYSKKRAK